jgi:hypothetical protein
MTLDELLNNLVTLKLNIPLDGDTEVLIDYEGPDAIAHLDINSIEIYPESLVLSSKVVNKNEIN